MRAYSHPSYTLEQRLNAWHELQRQADKIQRHSPCVTISREFGCQGFAVATALEQRLSALDGQQPWLVVDKALLEKIAEDSGYSSNQLEKVRTTPGIINTLLTSILEDRPDQYEVFFYTRKAIRHFAEQGNVILVGRGGVCMTKDRPHCLHVRLIAPLDFRIKKIMQTYEMNEQEAKNFIEAHQKERSTFFRKFTNHDEADPSLYHLIFGNHLNTPDEIAEGIVSCLQIKKMI